MWLIQYCCSSLIIIIKQIVLTNYTNQILIQFFYLNNVAVNTVKKLKLFVCQKRQIAILVVCLLLTCTLYIFTTDKIVQITKLNKALCFTVLLKLLHLHQKIKVDMASEITAELVAQEHR